jgi:hypothetical protein
MGEVYRAHDARLNRDVALKVLPDAFVRDRDRLVRFQREAQALAALNHPHIAQILGLEETGAGPALVLEFVDGPTLAEAVPPSPMPTRLTILPPQGQELYDDAADAVISPDGRLVVFATGGYGTVESQLWVREVSGLTPRRLDGTTGGVPPVLVARQPANRLLRSGQAPHDGSRRRSRDGCR